MEKSMLLEAYLKQLRLPAICQHYQEVARQAVQGNFSYEVFLLALVELEAQQREENAHQKRLRQARFPVVKPLDQFDFTCVPSLNKAKVLSLAQGEYLERKENLILMGNSGTGKTHLATALGLLACQQGKKVRFLTAAGLINHLAEAQAALRLSHLERSLAQMDLLIIDEVGYVPFSEKGSQLFFQVVAQGYERQSLIITTNLEFSQWPQVLGSEQLTGAMLDRDPPCPYPGHERGKLPVPGELEKREVRIMVVVPEARSPWPGLAASPGQGELCPCRESGVSPGLGPRDPG